MTSRDREEAREERATPAGAAVPLQTSRLVELPPTELVRKPLVPPRVPPLPPLPSSSAATGLLFPPPPLPSPRRAHGSAAPSSSSLLPNPARRDAPRRRFRSVSSRIESSRLDGTWRGAAVASAGRMSQPRAGLSACADGGGDDPRRGSSRLSPSAATAGWRASPSSRLAPPRRPSPRRPSPPPASRPRGRGRRRPLSRGRDWCDDAGVRANLRPLPASLCALPPPPARETHSSATPASRLASWVPMAAAPPRRGGEGRPGLRRSWRARRAARLRALSPRGASSIVRRATERRSGLGRAVASGEARVRGAPGPARRPGQPRSAGDGLAPGLSARGGPRFEGPRQCAGGGAGGQNGGEGRVEGRGAGLAGPFVPPGLRSLGSRTRARAAARRTRPAFRAPFRRALRAPLPSPFGFSSRELSDKKKGTAGKWRRGGRRGGGGGQSGSPPRPFRSPVPELVHPLICRPLCSPPVSSSVRYRAARAPKPRGPGPEGRRRGVERRARARERRARKRPISATRLPSLRCVPPPLPTPPPPRFPRARCSRPFLSPFLFASLSPRGGTGRTEAEEQRAGQRLA